MKLEELINKYYHLLHENDFHILKYILEHRHTCYELGINTLANHCNVSRSSVLRLSQKLGFSGYSEFKIYLKWEDQDTNEEEGDCVSSLYTDITEAVKYTKAKDFSTISELIYSAERIFVYGTGIAQLNFADELQRMFLAVQCHLYVIKAQREFEIVLDNLTDKDLVLVISLSGDTPEVIPLVQSLVSKGVPIVSITNLKNNRLATMTPYNLYANSSEILVKNACSITTFSSFFILGEAMFRHYVAFRSDQLQGNSVIKE